MPKSYLRYVPTGIHGVIASSAAPFAVDPTGQLVFTAQLERVGVWHARRGVEVSPASPFRRRFDISSVDIGLHAVLLLPVAPPHCRSSRCRQVVHRATTLRSQK